MKHFLTYLVTDVLVILAFVLSYLATIFLILPLQHAVLGTGVLASLLFLPHGVRVIATWLFGLRSVYLLTIAEFIAIGVFPTVQFPLTTIGMGAIIGGLSCWLVFEAFKHFGSSYFFDDRDNVPNWKTLILLAAGGSAVNSFGKIFVYRDEHAFTDEVVEVLGFLTGDIFGTVTLLVLFMLINSRVTAKRPPQT